tara:strand:+ start:641 stop:844 length:204 start_codon:yes stop_codon:yes gene_type:complete
MSRIIRILKQLGISGVLLCQCVLLQFIILLNLKSTFGLDSLQWMKKWNGKKSHKHNVETKEEEILGI